MFGNSTPKHQAEAKTVLMSYFDALKAKNPNLEFLGYVPNYFIFNQDVIHFRSTKLNDERHGWLFGIWARYDKDFNIIGCTYFGEADAFINKFKPSYTNISEDDADKFIARIAKLESDPKQGLIDEYFAEEDEGNDGKADYDAYWARKEDEKRLREEILSFMQSEIPRLVKESGLGLRGIAIVDENWRSGWRTSPRFKLYGWESCKQARLVSNDEYWKLFDEKIIDKYCKALESKFPDCDSWIRMDYEIRQFDNMVWTNQDAMCSLGRYITFFENPLKEVRHARKKMLCKIRN